MENQETRICENCGKKHDGSYGSGRFCSKHCSCSFSAKKQQKCNWPNSKPKCSWECRCGQTFLTRRLLNAHKCNCEINKAHKICIHFDDIKNKHVYENELFAYLSQGWEIGQYFKNNTGRASTEEKELERKAKISKSMKLAFAEGRNIGWAATRKQFGGMSYPEKYFEQCILNSFDDKKYEYNYPVGKYKLDFAWPSKKVYIEIDGKQHFYKEFIEHDKIRNEYLTSNGWICIFRVIWSSFKMLSENEKENLIKELSNAVNESKNINDFFDRDKIIEIELEKQLKRKKLIDNKQIDSIGRLYPSIITEEELIKRKNLILDSNVDLMKYGWVSKVIKKTGLSKRVIETTVKKFPEIFEGKIFRRKFNNASVV